MSSKDYRKRLNDIIVNVDAILGYIADGGYEAFAADRRTVDATERCIERIAEAIIKIGPEQFAQIDATVPFERVRGLGNLMRHAYDLIDEHLTYNLAMQELPRLREAAARAMGT